MPVVNLSTIYSFSSEDPVNPASNLLTKTSKKWKCKSSGEPLAYVIFQLDKLAQITGIDIGNEHSAHISVFVGKKGGGQQDFKEILLASSFMTPSESKAGKEINRVRFFAKSGLIEMVASQKWDLVKVVCTQPYNKHVQYGLAFIKLHAVAEADTGSAKAKPLVPAQFLGASSNSNSPLSKFKLREDSSDSDGDTTSSLFSRWKQGKAGNTESSPLSAAAAIRDSAQRNQSFSTKPKFSPQPSTSRKPAVLVVKDDNDDDDDESKEKMKRKDRNRDDLLYNEDDDKPNEKLEKKLQHDIAQREKNQQKKDGSMKSKTMERLADKFKDFVEEDDKSTSSQDDKSKDQTARSKWLQKPSPSRTSSSSSSQSDRKKEKRASDTPKPKLDKTNSKASRYSPVASVTPIRKRMSSPSSNEPGSKKNRKEITYKPFNKLLEGVVLVISGIQNPIRGQLRDQALELGAKYKPDWDNSCTHLICAFKNTPKYNQVQGHGKIIKKEWITSCYDAKRRLPWRRYALESTDMDDPESEDEILDIKLKPPTTPMPSTSSSKNRAATKSDTKYALDSSDEDDCIEMAEVVSDDDRYNEKSNYARSRKNEILLSGSDTEDELDRIRQKKVTATIQNSIEPIDVDEIYNKTTDEEQPKGIVASNGINDKPVTPLPEFYKGKQFYLSDNIGAVEELKMRRYIIVYGGRIIQNAANADYVISTRAKALPSDYNGEVVKPLWVMECHEMECWIPTARYKFDV